MLLQVINVKQKLYKHNRTFLLFQAGQRCLMHMTTTKDNSLWIDGDGRNISCVKGDCACSIVMLTIGIFGTLFYGSHLVKDIQTNQTLSPPYTTISQVKDQNP